MAVSKPEPKTKSFSGRARQSDWDVIELAARRQDLKVSDYVVRAARVQAELDLADVSSFTLPADRYVEFLAALDRPPQAKPELVRLLARQPVWDNK